MVLANHFPPHPSLLPRGEGELHSAFCQINDGHCRMCAIESAEIRLLFPLPEGEGQGERRQTFSEGCCKRKLLAYELLLLNDLNKRSTENCRSHTFEPWPFVEKSF